MRRADVAAETHAVAVRQSNVQHGDVRKRRIDASERFVKRPGFADDTEVGLHVDELRDAAPHDLVIVHEEHPDHASPDSDPYDAGTDHSMRVPLPLSEMMVHVPPRSWARSVTFASPLR